MRIKKVCLYFEDDAGDEVRVFINRNEAFLAPYGADPQGIITHKIVYIAKVVAAVFKWRPFFLDMDQEEKY